MSSTATVPMDTKPTVCWLSSNGGTSSARTELNNPNTAATAAAAATTMPIKPAYVTFGRFMRRVPPCPGFCASRLDQIVGRGECEMDEPVSHGWIVDDAELLQLVIGNKLDHGIEIHARADPQSHIENGHLLLRRRRQLRETEAREVRADFGFTEQAGIVEYAARQHVHLESAYLVTAVLASDSDAHLSYRERPLPRQDARRHGLYGIRGALNRPDLFAADELTAGCRAIYPFCLSCRIVDVVLRNGKVGRRKDRGPGLERSRGFLDGRYGLAVRVQVARHCEGFFRQTVRIVPDACGLI